MSLIGETAAISFEVVARRADLAEFAASIGADPASSRLPTTFPIRWLTDPRIVEAVKRLASDRPQSLPVHELQTVEPFAPLPVDAALTIAAKAARTDDIHIALEAEVRDGAAVLARLAAILRLVP